MDFLLRFATPCFPAMHCYLQCFPLLEAQTHFLRFSSVRNQTAQHGPLCLFHRAYSIQCVLHELSMTNVKNNQRGNSNECHFCAGAMHGHEQCAKTFGLLLANVELPLAFATVLARLLRPNLNCKFRWVSLGLGGIMLTGSCHHSPA